MPIVRKLNVYKALFEFNLLRHYGGFPIVDRIYEVDDPELQTKRQEIFQRLRQSHRTVM